VFSRKKGRVDFQRKIERGEYIYIWKEGMPTQVYLPLVTDLIFRPMDYLNGTFTATLDYAHCRCHHCPMVSRGNTYM